MRRKRVSSTSILHRAVLKPNSSRTFFVRVSIHRRRRHGPESPEDVAGVPFLLYDLEAEHCIGSGMHRRDECRTQQCGGNERVTSTGKQATGILKTGHHVAVPSVAGCSLLSASTIPRFSDKCQHAHCLCVHAGVWCRGFYRRSAMAFRRYEPLSRHPLVYIEFNEEGAPIGVVDVPRHLRAQYRYASLDELHSFALEHNYARQQAHKDARRAYRVRTHRSANTKRDYAAPEFAAYNETVYLDARAIGQVSRAVKTLGEWLDRWQGAAAAGSVGAKLLLALYVKTQDPVLGLLFQEEGE